MSLNIKYDAIEIVGRHRPYVNIPTSMIQTIKANVTRLLNEDIQGDPIMIAAIHSVWKNEIRDAEMELIQRN
jgi:hypothetical protein